MQAGAEARHHAELLPVAIGLARNRVGNREEAVHAASARHPVIERPRHDDFIADIGVNLATMRDDRGIDVEKEAGEKILHAELAHRLRKRGGAGEIEKHQHALFPDRRSISAKRYIEKHPAANQTGQFKNHSDKQGPEKRGRNDPGKCVDQPVGLDPMPIKQRLQA